MLDAGLQNTGFKIPKWNPRSRLGVSLRQSPCQAENVVLVLNPKTLHVSPQYHVVFDDDFSTIPFLIAGDIPPNWSILVKNCTESVTNEDFDFASTWCNGTNIPSQDSVSNEEGLDASDPASVVSHSVTFANPIVQDTSDNVSSRISEEDTTSIAEEGDYIASEEGVLSVSEEDTINCHEE